MNCSYCKQPVEKPWITTSYITLHRACAIILVDKIWETLEPTPEDTDAILEAAGIDKDAVVTRIMERIKPYLDAGKGER